MGLLNDIAGNILGRLFGSGGQSGLSETLKDLLTNPETGGLEGMIEKFKTNGLGDLIGSWIGKGENMPISPEQIKEALGSEQIQKIAQGLGLSTDQASSRLADFLPGAIDKLTPDGQMPSTEMLSKALEMFKGR